MLSSGRQLRAPKGAQQGETQGLLHMMYSRYEIAYFVAPSSLACCALHLEYQAVQVLAYLLILTFWGVLPIMKITTHSNPACSL